MCQSGTPGDEIHFLTECNIHFELRQDLYNKADTLPALNPNRENMFTWHPTNEDKMGKIINDALPFKKSKLKTPHREPDGLL